jgi:hypothetical protein
MIQYWSRWGWSHPCLHGMLPPPLHACCWQPSSFFPTYPSSSAWIDHRTSFHFWPYLNEPLLCNHWNLHPFLWPASVCPITFSGVMWFWYWLFHFMSTRWRWAVVHPKFFGTPCLLIIPKALDKKCLIGRCYPITEWMLCPILLESFGRHNCLNKFCHHIYLFRDVFFASH